MKVIIVGGNAAGMSAASKLRRVDRQAEIIVIEKGMEVSYGSCGLPYYIGGLIDSSNSLRIRAVEEFRNRLDIQVRTGDEVIGLDPSEKKISILGKGGKKYSESYDKLVISTGASSMMPPFPGKNLKNIFTLKSLDDGERIKEAVQSGNVENVTVIGSGFIGLELVESFLMQRKKVRVIEMAPRIMSTFEPEITHILENKIKDLGVDLHLGESVKSFEGSENVTSVVTDKGSYKTDLVIVSVGVSPNTKFLNDVEGFEFLNNGAIIVNSRMETGVPDVYAGGDCASVYNEITKEDTYIGLATNANKQGKIIGTILGGQDKELPGRLGTSALKFMDIEAAKTGVSLIDAEKAGLQADSVVVRTTLSPAYYNDKNFVLIKLVYESGTNKVLGACMVGNRGTALRIDVFVTAITAGMTVEDISNLDLAYSPPFSHPWDAVQVAANAVK